MATKSPNRFYVPALDGLRVLACLMVFFHHGLPDTFLGRLWNSETIDTWWHALSQFGAYGVSIFFALSAFLITRLLMIERDTVGKIDVKDFYLRRILRIWPVYFVVIALSALLSPRFEGFGLSANNALGFGGFSVNFMLAAGGKIPYAVGILWSVCVEEQFYLVWPHVVKRLTTEKAFLTVAAVMVLVGWVSRLLIVATHPTWHAVWFNTFCQLDCFGWGVALAVLHRRNRYRLTFAQGTGLGVAALLTGWVLARFLPLVDYNSGPLPLANAAAYGITALIGATVVFSVAFTPESLFAKKPISKYGKYTYGLYCYHTLALVAAESLLDHQGTFRQVALWIILAFAITGISYYTLELPFLRLKKRFQLVASGAGQDSPPSDAEPQHRSPAA